VDTLIAAKLIEAARFARAARGAVRRKSDARVAAYVAR
jgi:predicted nucleotidyltransferase